MKKGLFLLITLLFTSVVFAQIPCVSPVISGNLTYDNILDSPLNKATVFLRTLTGTISDSCVTNGSGYFSFCFVASGNYKLTAKTSYPWGGVNATDALIALHHFTELSTLTGVKFRAGDVNVSSYINATDAHRITRRFLNMVSNFPIEDWVFEEPQIVVSNTTPQIINFKGICTGDLDGSYVPFIQSFVTCGDTLTDQRDNQKYPTVQIGSQCWMKKNLNIGTFVISTITPYDHSNCSNNGIIEKYCYGNDPVMCSTYGGFYDWNEMMQYDTTEGIQGICPTGWHVPSDSDWCTLTTSIDTTINCNIEAYIGSDIGSKMKETGFDHWSFPNTGATNQSGFTALGAGNRSKNGTFGVFNRSTSFWTSSSLDNLGILWLGGLYNQTNIARSFLQKSLGMSVRCIRN